MTAPGTRPRRIGVGVYLFFLAAFALVLFLGHAPFLALPYYWDEVGQFIPAALDFSHGVWIAHSPSLHPPAVAAYLAGAWAVAGSTPVATKAAMLLAASFGVLAAFLLAIELSKRARNKPALLAVGLLCLSPVFFSQSMLAQLDAPAMLFASLALLWFLQNRMALAGAACLLLALTNETGLIVPLVFAGWLAYERRWRDMAWFAPAVLALGAWAAVLKHATGYWGGSAEFLRAGLTLNPAEIGITFVRRAYYLFVANLHWIGTAAMIYAWRKSALFQSRAWRIAWALIGAHIVLLGFSGEAALNRHLLPVLPILYAAMAGSLMEFPKIPRIAYSAALLAGLAACNLINPPYPFPLEDNLAFSDFVRLQRDAADYLQRNFPQARVSTVWPMTVELAQPELGYVKRAMAVRNIHDFSKATLDSTAWGASDVVVVYSRTWDPARSLMRWNWVSALWTRWYGPLGDDGLADVESRIPFPSLQRLELGGQWIQIYANRRRGHAPFGWPAAPAAGSRF